MDGELTSFIKVWISAFISLSYCFYIVSRFTNTILKLISLLPIFILFFLLPLNLYSFHFCGPTSFFLIWLANFKLLLFAFDQGPLSPPPKNLLRFISVACLPIKIKNRSGKESAVPDLKSRNQKRIPLPIEILILALLFQSYQYKRFLHPYVILALYCCHVYIELDILLAISVIPARSLLGFEIEPQSNEPYLATSLQDFWGRRWNLMVTSILRPTVYDPIRGISKSFLRRTFVPIPAVIATFAVSGLMHEILYYYMTRVYPTWEVTWFFVLHGVCTAVEVMVKEVVPVKWWLNRVVSGMLTLGFLAVTAVWLFFPQLIRNGVDEKAISEYYLFVDFVKNLFPKNVTLS